MMTSFALTAALLLNPAPKMESAYLGAGCFWCVEILFEELRGVAEVESGYSGGTVKNPTYSQVSMGKTGHAEVINITFNPKIISRRDLFRIFFTVHDPTTKDRQGNDIGTQYRSVIFYQNEAERKLALEVINEVTKAKIWPNKIVTTLEPFKAYYRAESYHQDYYERFERASEAERAEMNAGYCRMVIAPKVLKFREKYAAKLRKSN